MTYGIVLCGQLLHFLLEAFASILQELLELCDDVALLLQVGMLLAACAGILLIACIEELVAGGQEFFPELVALFARHDARFFHSFCSEIELVAGLLPLGTVG